MLSPPKKMNKHRIPLFPSSWMIILLLLYSHKNQFRLFWVIRTSVIFGRGNECVGIWLDVCVVNSILCIHISWRWLCLENINRISIMSIFFFFSVCFYENVLLSRRWQGFKSKTFFNRIDFRDCWLMCLKNMKFPSRH